MCEAISATTMAGLAIASAVASTSASLYAQQQQSDAQASYQSAMSDEYARTAKLNQEAANKEYIEAAAAERINEMQQQASASEELQKLQQEKMQKQGQALASSEAAGTALDALMADYERSAAQKRDVIMQQLDMVGVNADTAISGYKDKAEARMKSQSNYVSSPINQPNYLGGALSIAGAGFSAYDKYVYQPEQGAKRPTAVP